MRAQAERERLERKASFPRVQICFQARAPLRARQRVGAPPERISEVLEYVEIRRAARKHEFYVSWYARDATCRRSEPLHLPDGLEAEVRVECWHADMIKEGIHTEDVGGARMGRDGVLDDVGEELDGEVDGAHV